MYILIIYLQITTVQRYQQVNLKSSAPRSSCRLGSSDGGTCHSPSVAHETKAMDFDMGNLGLYHLIWKNRNDRYTIEMFNLTKSTKSTNLILRHDPFF